MIFDKLLYIMKTYEQCPNCGSSTIGNGQGGIFVESNTYTRTCKCGFNITVDENNNEIITKEKFTCNDCDEKDNKNCTCLKDSEYHE